MCTVTWTRGGGGFSLMFNRDESRRRFPEKGPRLQARRGVRFLAPVDGDYGGSWIAVSEFGLALGLLNGYREREQPPYDGPAADRLDDYVSRGGLVLELASVRNVAGTMKHLREMDLTPFRSFRLLAIDLTEARVASWDARGLSVATALPADVPLVSSAYQQAQVTRVRRTTFGDTCDAGCGTEALLAFHRSHLPERGPLSPCMHRDDARTVSFSHVSVGPDEVRFRYVGDAPCRGVPDDPPLRLERAPAAVD